MTSNLHKSLDNLRDDLTKMIKLVKKQLKLTYEAILTHDKDLTEEVIHRELRINALELQIDSACEQIFALYKPVAIDLRFVLSVINMNSNLERIADLAEGAVRYIKDMDRPFEKETLEKIQLQIAFDTAISMLDNVQKGFKQEDTKIVRKVFNQDEIIDKINAKSSKIIIQSSQKNPNRSSDYLYLFSIMNKIERVGDLVENTAEDIIFYIEAKVLKHTN